MLNYEPISALFSFAKLCVLQSIKPPVPDNIVAPGSPQQMRAASRSGFWGDNGPTEIEDTEIIYKECVAAAVGFLLAAHSVCYRMSDAD